MDPGLTPENVTCQLFARVGAQRVDQYCEGDDHEDGNENARRHGNPSNRLSRAQLKRAFRQSPLPVNPAVAVNRPP